MVSATKPRLDYIDVAKGIGILLVVLGHIVPWGSSIQNYIYSFHMPLFFIISGILLSYNDYWKNNDFCFTIKRKAKSLLWPYLVFSIIWLLFYFILKPDMFLDNFVLFITFNGIWGLWFLSTLFFAEVIFIFLVKKCNFKLRVFCIALMIILSSIYILLVNNFGFDENIIIYLICRFFLACIFLFIGYYSIKFKSKVSLSNNVILFMGFIAIIINIYLSLFCHVNFHYLDISNLFLFYINAILGSYGIIVLCKLIIKKCSFLMFYGKNSLIVFITHEFVLGFIRRVPIGFLSFDLVLFIITIILCAIIVLVINKYFRFLINYDSFKDLVFKFRSILRI